jgi:F-box interacting protein
VHLWFLPENIGIFLVNPTIDDAFLELPKERRTTVKYDKFIGLGYDSNSNKYKVVTLYCHHDKTLGCELLTIGNALWRRLGEALPFKLTRNQTPVFVNGTIHWKIETKRGETGLKILCFDIIQEIFDTIVHPDCNSFSDDIIEYGGSLCIYKRCADSWRCSLLVLTD